MLETILVVAVLVLAFRMRHIHYAFVVRLQSGKVSMVKGYVPRSYLQECRQLMRGRKVQGLIKGRYVNGEVVLSFSRSISEDDQIRFQDCFPYQLCSQNASSDTSI